MLVGRAREQAPRAACVEDVVGIGEVLRHFLLDGAALLVPVLLAVEHALHAHRFDVQRDVEIFGGTVKRYCVSAFARVGVEVAAHDAADIGELVGGEPGAAAEHHVFLRMRGAGKSVRRFVGADEIVHRGRHDRRQRVAHDDDAQAVGSVARSTSPSPDCGAGEAAPPSAKTSEANSTRCCGAAHPCAVKGKS